MVAFVPDTRGSMWVRWPDREAGPLWLGLHLNERGGLVALVGLEIWTEAPGEARRSLGPAADPAEDLLPWPPVPVKSSDLTRLSMMEVRRLLAGAVVSVEAPKPGRGPMYGPDHYPRVAGVYLNHVEAGSRSPTLDVARAWTVSRSVAARWVMQCRRRGLIPPA